MYHEYRYITVPVYSINSVFTAVSHHVHELDRHAHAHSHRTNAWSVGSISVSHPKVITWCNARIIAQHAHTQL